MNFSALHVNHCPYCKLANHVREEWEYSKDVMSRVLYSDDPDDTDLRRRQMKAHNILYRLVEQMDKWLDIEHERQAR